jgi:hypothetical protein
MIHMPNRPHIYVRLGALEFFLGHSRSALLLAIS